MAITKTKFINYIRCPRYVSLENIRKEDLTKDMSFEEYLEEENNENIKEILDNMTDEEGNDLIDIDDPQLEVMMPYYKEIEELAGKYVDKMLEGTPRYNQSTFNQESFDFIEKGIKYLCYVDIYNERKDSFDIIEVKSTTSNKFLKVGKTINKEFISLFEKDEKGIYKLIEEIEDYKFDDFKKEDYLKIKAKLFDKYSPFGHYIYDLAVQRYIIEKDLIKNESKFDKDKINYYLAVLNKDYIYDGTELNGKKIYNPDENGNDIICLVDLTKLTKDFMDKIKLDFDRVYEYIMNNNSEKCPLGEFCENKKKTKCKFIPVCFAHIPHDNSVLSYKGPLKVNGMNKLDLININKLNMLDIKESELKSNTHIIQRKVVESKKEYVDKEKIKAGLNALEYPIYHLDFETFPCPLPRFKGEKCYNQSVFQFSLHIEKEEGICDKEKDNFAYLAKDNINDYRKEIAKKLCEWIDIDNGGMVLAHNVSFERTRLKELSKLFEDDIQIKNKLLKMSAKEHSFDTIYLVDNNKELYENLGITKNIDTVNYYHEKLNGSYSIKKVLPIFTNLSYKDLEVQNGTEALVTYAKFDKMDKKEYEERYNALLKYCQQDTWAMVEILKGLRELVK